MREDGMGISLLLCFWSVKICFCFGSSFILFMVVRAVCMHTKCHLENMEVKGHLRVRHSWEPHIRMNQRSGTWGCGLDWTGLGSNILEDTEEHNISETASLSVFRWRVGRHVLFGVCKKMLTPITVFRRYGNILFRVTATTVMWSVCTSWISLNIEHKISDTCIRHVEVLDLFRSNWEKISQSQLEC
jgi:hypothetical protein